MLRALHAGLESAVSLVNTAHRYWDDLAVPFAVQAGAGAGAAPADAAAAPAPLDPRLHPPAA